MQIIEDLKLRVASGEVFDWELMLEGVYRRWIRPGDTVIDIGAHVGRHLFPLWESIADTGRVIAFEPLPNFFTYLAGTFQASNIEIINAAVGVDRGTSPFVFARGTPEESGFRRRVYNLPELANPVVIQVATTVLDDHTRGRDRLSFIKIDVEGGEMICLASATRTIADHRPVISVEWGRPTYSAYGYDAEDLHKFATGAYYKIFDLFLNDITDLETWRSACDQVYWDYLLVPEERTSEFLLRCQSGGPLPAQAALRR